MTAAAKTKTTLLPETRVWASSFVDSPFSCPSTSLSSTLGWGSGHRRDRTASDQLDQRFYTSQFGRFMSADRYKKSAVPGIPSSWNRYTYVLGDPVSQSDPTGQTLFCDDDDCDESEDPGDTQCDSNGTNCYDSVTVNGDEVGGGSTAQTQSTATCFALGVGVGVAGGLVVAGAAAAAAEAGVPAGVVSLGLFVAGGVGTVAGGWQLVNNLMGRNYKGAAFTLGTLAGGIASGSVTGGSVGDSINPPATRGFWSLRRDWENRFQVGKGSVLQFFATGPDAAAATGATGFTASAAAWLQGLFAGCSQ